MFSGKLGVMEQKWGHSSSLTDTAATALTEADVSRVVRTQAIAPSSPCSRHYDVISSGPVLFYSESGLPGSGGAELVGKGLKSEGKKKKKKHSKRWDK